MNISTLNSELQRALQRLITATKSILCENEKERTMRKEWREGKAVIREDEAVFFSLYNDRWAGKIFRKGRKRWKWTDSSFRLHSEGEDISMDTELNTGD